MKLATTTGDFGGYASDIAGAVALIKEAGFKYADYSFGRDYGRRDGIYGDNWKEYLADLQEKMKAMDMKFVQSHAPMGIPGSPLMEDKDYHKQFVADTRRSIEACGILGIPTCVVHSGYLKDISKEECFERNREFYREIIEPAEQYGVNVLIENFNKMSRENIYWVDNATDLLAMIEYVDHPMVHACWDAGHANMQEMPQDEELKILGAHVKALHIQDNRENGDHHLAPYFGTINLDAVINGLIDIDYKGYFTFETGVLSGKRREYEKDTRLKMAPLGVKMAAEKLLYEIGKCALDAYGLYEE